MSKKANLKLIGVFVVAAIALLIYSLVALTSGSLFKTRYTYALYFDQSVRGLNEGSSVFFKGVQVGYISSIRLFYNAKDSNMQSVVLINLEPDNIIRMDSRSKLVARPEEVNILIDKGLKAQLNIQSFVTGQLVVILDFFPDIPLEYKHYLKEYIEIPTAPTQFEQIAQALQELKLKEVMKKMIKTIDGIESFVNAPETKDGIKSFLQTGKDVNRLVKKMDEQFIPLVADIKETSQSARKTLVQVEKTFALNEGVPGEIASDVQKTLKQARATLDKVDKSLASVEKFTDQGTETTYQVQDTMKELSGIAASLRALADYLEQHPEALIRGKAKQAGVGK